MKKARFMLKGGLGNQLFQLSCMLDVRKNTDFNPDYSRLNLKHDSLRELEILDLLSIVGFKEVDNSFLLDKSRFLYRLHKKVMQSCSSSYLYEQEFGSLDVLNELKDSKREGVVIDGYFQSIGHVLRNIDQLRSLIFENIKLNTESRLYKDLIEQSKFSVSLHVRRGDYVSDLAASKHHGVCGKDYYDRAVRHAKFKSNKSELVFFVFTDDMEWCKKNIELIGLSEIDNINFVERMNQTDSFQDMLLMSLCKFNIIANSTYSWWGAMISKKSCKDYVVAPKKWFSSDSISSSFIKSDWKVY